MIADCIHHCPDYLPVQLLAFVRLSVTLVILAGLNGSRLRKALHTVQQSDVSSFSTPNFIVVSSGVHPERVR